MSQMRVPPDDYSLFKQNLVADAACCAQFTLDQSWYRVRVVSITDRNTGIVYYIYDYIVIVYSVYLYKKR